MSIVKIRDQEGNIVEIPVLRVPEMGDGGDSGGSSDVYSTEETVVGTWIDGRPVYQRTFVATVHPTANSVTGTTLTTDINMNNARLVGSDVVTHDATRNHMTAGASEWSTNEANISRWSQMLLVPDALSYYARDNSQNTITVYATARYIKLADTATASVPSATALMDAYEEGVNDA